MKTRAEFNMALAIAIGWGDYTIYRHRDEILLPVGKAELLCPFDYMDPAVIWPIAKKYDIWPGSWMNGSGVITHWEAFWEEPLRGISAAFHHVRGATPEEAVARAVIEFESWRRAKEQSA